MTRSSLSALRLVTWNCYRGACAHKTLLLDSLAPDLIILQECARPDHEHPHSLWFGSNPKQGLAVIARNGYSLEALPFRSDVPDYMVPVLVKGPCDFLLMAVWAKQHPVHGYVGGVIRAVEIYRDLIASHPTVIAGDFNSNAIWNCRRPNSRDHAGLVCLLAEFGLVSSYHSFYHEQHGSETRPTFYWHWKQQKPYHIDYCFIPEEWSAALTDVHVGSIDDWLGLSDHRPLLVDVRLPEKSGSAAASARTSGHVQLVSTHL